MTKVQIRFRLEKPPDERMMEQIAAAHSIVHATRRGRGGRRRVLQRAEVFGNVGA